MRGLNLWGDIISEQIPQNFDTDRVTASDGVTGRKRFANYNNDSDGELGMPAKYVDIYNDGANEARILINLRSGNIATKYRTIPSGGNFTIQGGQIECVAYEGNGGDTELEITYGW